MALITLKLWEALTPEEQQARQRKIELRKNTRAQAVAAKGGVSVPKEHILT